jgi:hypothetical protein
MIHDRLCPMVTGKPPFRDDMTDDCLFCPLIAKVRNDTLDAALKALYAMENMGGYPEFAFDHIRDDFRDVLDALREKKP